MLKGFHCLNCSFCWYKYCIRSSKSNRTKTKNFILKGVVMQLSSDGWRGNPLGNWVILISSGQKPCTMQSNLKHCILFYIFQMLLKGFKAWVKIKMCSERMNNWQYLSPGCLRADVSYFLCWGRGQENLNTLQLHLKSNPIGNTHRSINHRKWLLSMHVTNLLHDL